MTLKVAVGSRLSFAGHFPVVVGRWVIDTTGNIQIDF